MESIHQIVREAEDNYTQGTVKLGEYVEWSMHDTIETIDAYSNSKHTSGSTDSLGREKPFFNIVTAAVNVTYRATDLDRKNIKILPSKSNQTALAFLANVHLQQWMKDSRFAVFLNDWGRALSKYGSAVCKFVEKDGKLIASVVPWNRFIADPIEFDSIPMIEKLYYTPAQLKRMDHLDQDMVDQLIKSAQESRETTKGFEQDQNDNFIELYEVHGELPLSLLTENENDEETYVQQMHIVAFVDGKDDGEFVDFTLFSGREEKNPYMVTHLIKEDGRTLGIGTVELLFDAQWMVNHTQKNTKDTLDLASKLIFQTSDSNFIGRNVLTAIETGDIFIHKDNQPVTQINNTKADISALQNYGIQWQSLATELTSTPEAIRGQTLPSGTPYSLGAFLGAQANSLFEIMTENKGLHLEDMMRTYVIPHLKKKMNTKDEIVATLDEQEISEIDAMFVPREAVRRFNTRALDQLTEAIENPEAPLPQPFNRETEEQGVRESLAPLGNKRFFKPDEIGEKTWKDALKDLEMTVTVEVTNENTDKQAVLTTLGSVLQTVASNPGILQDPNARLVFNEILKQTAVISPIQLSTAQASASPPTPTGETTGGTRGLVEELPQANQQA